MARPPENPTSWPFTSAVLGIDNVATDLMPASYHYYDASGRRLVADPSSDISSFLYNELSLGRLNDMLQHLWFAGAKHAPRQLHFQLAVGREIVIVDRMDLHLVWDNDGRMFLKPIPRFLLHSQFWQNNLKCHRGCTCPEPPAAFYFFLANDKRLIPRKAGDATIEWAEWKNMTRELLRGYRPERIHPRFLHAELRLSRINMIHRYTRFPPFESYIRGWNNYGSFYRDNLAWMSATAIFVALVLTAMQLGLATERLQADAKFQSASYGFTVFSILGPIIAFGLMVLGALVKFVITDLPAALKHR